MRVLRADPGWPARDATQPRPAPPNAPSQSDLGQSDLGQSSVEPDPRCHSAHALAPRASGATPAFSFWLAGVSLSSRSLFLPRCLRSTEVDSESSIRLVRHTMGQARGGGALICGDPNGPNGCASRVVPSRPNRGARLVAPRKPPFVDERGSSRLSVASIPAIYVANCHTDAASASPFDSRAYVIRLFPRRRTLHRFLRP